MKCTGAVAHSVVGAVQHGEGDTPGPLGLWRVAPFWRVAVLFLLYNSRGVSKRGSPIRVCAPVFHGSNFQEYSSTPNFCSTLVLVLFCGIPSRVEYRSLAACAYAKYVSVPACQWTSHTSSVTTRPFELVDGTGARLMRVRT